MTDTIDASWSLGGLIADICSRAGVPYDRINVETLSGYVQGFATTNTHGSDSAIQALATVFQFDPCSYDGMLHFAPRGGVSVADVELDDLVDDGQEIERYSRRDGIEIPRVMHLEYTDIDGGLTSNKQTSDRSIDDRAQDEKTMQTSVVLGSEEAATAITVMHKLAIEEQRGEVEFSLPDSWIWLTVSDVINLDGQRLRITEVEIDDGFQKYKAVHDRLTIYSTTITGVAPPTPDDPPSLVVAPSVLQFIDCPIIDSDDDELGYYIAVSSDSLNWEGAEVDFSRDSGANWVDSDATTVNATMGSLISGCGVHSVYYRDDVNTLDVQLLRDDMELISATQAEMQNRVNLALIGDELVNFSTVVQLTATTWRLGGFLRGRKGTTAAAHVSGERFVLMDSLTVTFIPAELFDLGKDLTFRAISYNLSTGDNVTGTFTGQSQVERQPAYLKAVESGSDLIVTWQGVGRLGGGAAVAMGAYFSHFLITLGSNTWTTTDNTITIPYAAGTLSVQQVNSITGAGPAASVSV